jgi:NADPH-dependent 2,4-dienoyl-CoA reductase/sulfur reductase-like enzyme
MSAASQAKRRAPSAEVIVFERGEHISYGACGLPYNIEDPNRSIEDLVVVTPAQAVEKRGLHVRLKHEVTEIDPENQVITVANLETEEVQREKYDALIIATGARPIRPPLGDEEIGGVLVLRNLEDGAAIKKDLEAGASRFVIVGGGYIAMEMAHVLRSRNAEVTILEKMPQLLPGWHPDTVERVNAALQENGVSVVTGATVTGFQSDDDRYVQSVVTKDRSYEADAVLLAVGVKPNSELASSCGLRIGDSGAIWVNQYQETSYQNIWAAGDCAEAYHRVLRKNTWLPLGTTANKQGRVAGANAVGGKQALRGIVGTSGFLVFDLEVARTGLSLDQAKAEGFKPVTATIRQRSRGHAFTGASTIQVTLIADKPTGMLLGAELTGAEGAALRSNTLAAALAAHMSVRDVQNLDLVYAPPFAPVWDPVLVAANQLAKKVGRNE